MLLMCILNLGIDRYKVMTNGPGASGEDRISKLPRGLITRILIHLNIHEVARTSVLSKTWSKFWPTHPCLILGQRFYSEITCNKKESTHISEFHKVFNMILSAHTGPIIKFILYVSPMLSRCFNHEWIEKLYEKGLRDLYLAFEVTKNNERYVVPSTLFGCQDLIQFRLMNSVIGGPSGMPGRSSFPNLTSVQLSGTKITLDMTFGTQLQSLYLQSCSGIEHLAPQFTTGNNLQNLYFYDCKKIEWQWFQCTTKLVILGLTLTAANSNMKKKVNKLIKLLSKIPTFSSLALNGPTLEVFGPPPSDLTMTIKKVRVLKLLRLTLYNLCQMSNVGYLIRSFPNLQYLAIQLELDQVQTLNATELTTERYLGSLDGKDMFLDKLQTVDIQGVEDLSYVFPFIKHLLACSPSLKVISLFCTTKINDPKEKLQVKQELQQLPRLSLNARVIIGAS